MAGNNAAVRVAWVPPQGPKAGGVCGALCCTLCCFPPSPCLLPLLRFPAAIYSQMCHDSAAARTRTALIQRLPASSRPSLAPGTAQADSISTFNAQISPHRESPSVAWTGPRSQRRSCAPTLATRIAIAQRTPRCQRAAPCNTSCAGTRAASGVDPHSGGERGSAPFYGIPS